MKPIRRAYVIVGLTILSWLVVAGLALLIGQIFHAWAV
jgi:hypothetical protein